MFIPLPSANYFFLGFGVGVAFELAVFLGVGVAPLGALGACGVLWGLLGCTMCAASVSRNVGDLTETDKPVRKTWLSRRGWRGWREFCFHLLV
jgi:hypothetical protein